MEEGDTEKYHTSSVIQDSVFLSQIEGCIGRISLQVHNKYVYSEIDDDNLFLGII